MAILIRSHPRAELSPQHATSDHARSTDDVASRGDESVPWIRSQPGHAGSVSNNCGPWPGQSGSMIGHIGRAGHRRGFRELPLAY
jgi:hypothetical protein